MPAPVAQTLDHRVDDLDREQDAGPREQPQQIPGLTPWSIALPIAHGANASVHSHTVSSVVPIRIETRLVPGEPAEVRRRPRGDRGVGQRLRQRMHASSFAPTRDPR